MRVGSIALAYFIASYASSLFPDTEQILVALWPAGGIALGALLLNPRRVWPVILLAIFVAGNSANLLMGRPLFNSLGFMTANVLESLTCATFMSWYCAAAVTFTRVREILALLLAATVLNAATALLGAATASLAHGANFWTFWQTWVVADGLGILVIAPLIVSWAKTVRDFPSARWPRILEGLVFLSLWCGLSWWIFSQHTALNYSGPHPHVLIALLAWPAFRLGLPGASTALVLLGGILVTSHGVRSGPMLFGGENPVERLLAAQFFLAFASATGYFLAASCAEMKAAEKSARDDHRRIQSLGDNLPNGMMYQVVRESDGRMRFAYVSAAVERMCGVSAEEVLRDASVLYRRYLPEDQARLATAEALSAKNLTPFNEIARIRQPDGELSWVQLSSSPRLLKDGRILWDGIHTDITELKRGEEALASQTLQLRTLLEVASDGIHVLDHDGNLITFSDSFPAMLGYSREEATTLNVADWDALFSREQVVDEVRKLLNKPATFETRHRRKDGTLFEVEINAKSIRLDGKAYIYASSRDITERKRAQEVVRASEKKYRTIIDASPVPYALIQDGQNVSYLNKAFSQLFGYTLEDIPTLNDWWSQAIPDAEYRHQVATSWRRNPHPCEPLQAVIRCKDGTTRTVLTTTTPMEEIRLVILYDITDRILAEEALFTANRQFLSVIESTGDIIAMLDNGYHYTLFNTAFHREVHKIFGVDLKPGDSLTRAFAGVSEDLALAKDYWGRALGGEDFTVLQQLGNTHRERNWYELHFSPIRNSEGKMVGAMHVVRNTTERKLSEEKIASSLREKETLLKEIHHRVKNNMAVVSSLLSLQARKIEDIPAKALFEESQQRVKAMALVHERLYQSKNLAAIPFEDYVKSIISEINTLYDLSSRAIKTEIRVENIELDLETAVPCGLLINELLTNAFKHAFPGQRSGTVSVHFSKAGNTHTLIVKDDGVGLPKNVDVQGANTLGLELAHVLAGQIGGTLHMKSDHGTEVVVTFPAGGKSC